MPVDLSSTINCAATTSANFIRQFVHLASTINCAATTNANVIRTFVHLASTIAGVCTASASMQVDVPMSSTINAGAATSAAMEVDVPLSSTIHCESWTNAAFQKWREYLGRPVFEFERDWSQLPAIGFQYELNDLKLGEAAPQFERLQDHTVQGFGAELLLENEAAIQEVDQFMEQFRGRLSGFWMASPFAAFEVLDNISATEFLIVDQSLRTSFEDHPSTHVVFTKAGAVKFAQITDVADYGGGREKVTIDASLSIDSGWDAKPLLYVRIAEDTEQGSYIADHLQERRLRVVELPNEYAAIETGQMPVYLYEFMLQTPGQTVNWRFNSFDVDIESQGQTFTSQGIKHNGHVDAINGEGGRFDIEGVYAAWNPLTQFVPFTLPVPLWVTAYETTYADPDTRSVIFTGLVESVNLQGKRIRAKCESLVKALGRGFPRMMIMPRCNYFLFSAPCGLTAADWDAPIQIDAIDGVYLTVSQPSAHSPDRFTGAAANFFAGGWLQMGSGQQFEIRTIQISAAEASGAIVLQLNAPLNFAQAGSLATIYAGCDKSRQVCDTKFDNFERWGGHVIAPRNPTVRALQPERPNGNKK